MTALVVQDRCGGEICRTVNEGVLHYWNRIDEIDVDLTRDQFGSWEPAEPDVVVAREVLLVSGPSLAARYEELDRELTR